MSSLPVAPPPWDLKGRGYTFLHQLAPFSSTPIPLPSSAYDPSETGTSADLSDRFHGGVGALMVVRYSDSPVGPYDELIHVPGLFLRKTRGGEVVYERSVTRIYVSSQESVINGRRNWGIPKHQAKFVFTPQGRATLVQVYSLKSSPVPIFTALLTPSRLPFSFPLNTNWLTISLALKFVGKFRLWITQPPLPSSEGSNSKELEESLEDLSTLVPSEGTMVIKLQSRGWGKLVSMSEGKGDGVGFPKVEGLLLGGRGAEVDFDMVFPVPDLVD